MFFNTSHSYLKRNGPHRQWEKFGTFERLEFKHVLHSVQFAKFIEKATGTTGMAGHGLQSCTSEVSVVELEYPGVKFCFVDTPGFDNTNKSDVDILKLVGKWLGMTYVTINDLL